MTPSLSRDDVAELLALEVQKDNGHQDWTAYLAALHKAAPALLSLASQFVDREPNTGLAVAIAKELRERQCTDKMWLGVIDESGPGQTEIIHAPLSDVIAAVLSVVAQREAEIRRAAIEGCAKIVDDRCAEVLSKQTGAPPDIGEPVNANLRMIAVLLPDLSEAMRALT